MDANEYTQLVGAIVTNLQALESVLRYFSMGNKAREVEFPKVGTADAPENALTKHDFLSTLVDQYNRSLTDEEQDFKVDRNVVAIRNAIAHGRLLATEQQPPFRLWKFGRAKNGRVPVEFCQELTEEWLTSTRNLIDSQKQKVVDCFIARGYKGLR
jgi:hypothetical protein